MVDPSIAAAAISAGTNLVTSVGQIFGQKSANDKNIALQRETNAQNYKMFQESQEFARNQQNLAMEYNDPASQASRLRAAGVNPAAVFGNGSVAQASPVSSPSFSPAVAPQVQPLDYASLAHSTSAFFENQLLSAQIDKTKQEGRIAQVQADFEQKSLEDRLAQVANDSSKSAIERDNARIHLRILRDTQDALIRQEGLKNDILDRQAVELDLRNESQRIANKIADVDLLWRNKEKSQQWALFEAKIREAVAAARAGNASAAASYASAALSEAQKSGVNIDNKTKERVQDYIVDKARHESNKAWYEEGLTQEQGRKAAAERRKTERETREGYVLSKFLPEEFSTYLLGH